MDGEYRKLHIRRSAPKSLRETTEGKYWRRFAAPTTIQQVRPGTRAPYNRGRYRRPADPVVQVAFVVRHPVPACSCKPNGSNALTPFADWYRLAHTLLPRSSARLCRHQLDARAHPPPAGTAAHLCCCLPWHAILRVKAAQRLSEFVRLSAREWSCLRLAHTSSLTCPHM